MALQIETTVATITDSDTTTVTFTNLYIEVPVVVATINDNVNVFVDSVSKTQAVIKTSQKGNYTVYVNVMNPYRGS